MCARQAAAPQAGQACSLAHMQERVQEVVKKTFYVVKKTSLKVLRQPKWTPEAGLNTEEGFFTTEHVFSRSAFRRRVLF